LKKILCTSLNYLIWQQLWLTGTWSQTYKIFDDSVVLVQFKATNEATTNIINLDFLNHEQDQLLVAWILASMTTLILTKIVDLESFYQIWTKLCT